MTKNKMIQNDGDIVRGLGFVSLYSAYLEEQIDNLLFLLSEVEEFDESRQRWPISREIEHGKKIICGLNTNEFDELIDVLTYCKDLFEKQNEFVHGRIYANFDRPATLRSGRQNVPEREIEASELYELANEFFNIRGEVYRPIILELPRFLNKRAS
jgi:hypothetical protein